jgi:hypothetical protein
VKRELERIEIPGEHDARVRTWDVVRTAYAEREPEPRRVRFVRPLLAAAVVAALVAAALSPPGRAVVDSVRKAIGVESADEALFSLPAPGRVLVHSGSGIWVASADGSKRRLGDYEAASWSPFGRFVVATRNDELAALTPNGEVRWKLSRPRVRNAAWGGSRADTRIAYVTDSRLHVVGGDGRGDRETGGATSPAFTAPAWRPQHAFELSYIDTRGHVYTFGVERPGANWRSAAIRDARRIVWTPRGDRLLVVGHDRLVWLRGSDGAMRVQPLRGAVDAAFAPDGRLALLRRVGSRSELVVDGKLRFSGTGSFEGVTWSPDGRFVLVAWDEPDQWLLFAPRRVRAIANVSRQFESRTFPRIEGWGPPAPDEP